jgi:phosphonate transport system substrate-binding protein
MKRNKVLYAVVFGLLVVSMLLTACAAASPAATPTAAATTGPTDTVVPTLAPTDTAAPTATTAPSATTAAPTATTGPTSTATLAPTATIPPAVCAKLSDAPTVAAGALGSPDKPITIAFVPSGDSGTIAKASSAIADCLNQMTGLTYTIQTGTSYNAAVEAMGAGKAQVGFLSTFAILAAEAKYGITPALINLRNYSTNDLDPDKALGGQLEPFYRGQFIANAASGIKTFADLKGKTFCYVDPLSASGYIVPRIILKNNKIDPDKDFKATQNAGSHPNVAIAVYKGDCDAGATYINVLTDASTNLAKDYPDITTKVNVFAVTDRIPNDGVQYIKSFDPKLQAVTTEALLAMSTDPGSKAVLAKLYSINAFQKIDATFTKLYTDFAAACKAAGVDPASLVK